jgi:hypothetical protein
MNVIYDNTSGEVIGVGDAVAGTGESTVELDESQITRPISGTVVDNVTNPTKTVNDLTKIKSQKKKTIKREAHTRLEPYDWYIIRKQEEGTVIPSKVSQYRSDVRSTEDDATAAVEAATSASEVRSIEPNWPDEPNV